jgi:hypothetical protein
MLAAIKTVMMFWAHGQLEVWLMTAVVHEDDMISSRPVPWMSMVDSVLEIWGEESACRVPTNPTISRYCTHSGPCRMSADIGNL